MHAEQVYVIPTSLLIPKGIDVTNIPQVIAVVQGSGQAGVLEFNLRSPQAVLLPGFLVT